MSLEINKSITLSATSTIEGTRVKNYNANFSTQDGSSSNNESIINIDLYNKNKAEIRKNDVAFQAKVYEVEDEIAADKEAVSKESQK